MIGATLAEALSTLLIIGLGGAAVAGVTIGIPRAIANYKAERYPNGTKKEREKRKEQIEKLRRHEMAVDKYVRDRGGSRVRTENTRVEFSNSNGQKIVYPFAEITSFDQTKDKIYRGIMGQYLEDGTYQTLGEVYLFQPRLMYKTKDPKTNTEVKQELTPNDAKGVLDQKQTYLINIANGKGPFYGYTPKREVLTGMRLDYVQNENRYCIDAETDQQQKELEDREYNLRSIIEIIVPRDNNGNLIPVDLNNPEEAKAFAEYKARHQKSPEDTSFYFKLYNIVETAKEKVKRGFTRRIKGRDTDYSTPVQTTTKKEKPREKSYEEKMADINETVNRLDKVGDYLRDANSHGPMPVLGGRPFGGMPPMGGPNGPHMGGKH